MKFVQIGSEFPKLVEVRRQLELIYMLVKDRKAYVEIIVFNSTGLSSYKFVNMVGWVNIIQGANLCSKMFFQNDELHSTIENDDND